MACFCLLCLLVPAASASFFLRSKDNERSIENDLPPPPSSPPPLAPRPLPPPELTTASFFLRSKESERSTENDWAPPVCAASADALFSASWRVGAAFGGRSLIPRRSRRGFLSASSAAARRRQRKLAASALREPPILENRSWSRHSESDASRSANATRPAKLSSGASSPSGSGGAGSSPALLSFRRNSSRMASSSSPRPSKAGA